jgi:hypothetical protein
MKAKTFDRVRYFQGARLTSRDLNDDVAYDARLLGVHVRGLHRTWGVGIGFRVWKSGNTIGVGPGIAFDCHGREIVSSETLWLDPPSVSKPAVFDLVVSYREEERTACAQPPAECKQDTTRPRVRWVLAGPLGAETDDPPPLAEEVRLGDDVPLARFEITPTSVNGPDLSLRRTAQGITRPHIVGTRVRAGSIQIEGMIASWSAQIDTTAAGFSETPVYVVSLVDHPLDFRSGFATMIGAAEREELLATLLGPFVAIRNPWSNGFRIEVRFGFAQGKSVPSSLQRGVSELPVGLDWLGIEPMSGCAPTPEPFKGFELGFYPIEILGGGLPLIIG